MVLIGINSHAVRYWVQFEAPTLNRMRMIQTLEQKIFSVEIFDVLTNKFNLIELVKLIFFQLL